MTDASVTAADMNAEERRLIVARVEELAAKVERLERLIAKLGDEPVTSRPAGDAPR
jgi:hypothetical protein